MDLDPSFYSHPCRCSGTFTITTAQLEAGEEVVQCDGCSERCRVEYDVIEEGEEQEGQGEEKEEEDLAETIMEDSLGGVGTSASSGDARGGVS